MKINENTFSLKDKVFTMVWNAIMFLYKHKSCDRYIIYQEWFKITIER